MLHPQDILVALKFLTPAREDRSNYAALAEALGMSVSETHGAVQRAVRSGLLIPAISTPAALSGMRVSVPAVSELLCHGIRYFLPAEVGGPALGIPTAESAPPLRGLLLNGSNIQPHVWKHSFGKIRGIAVAPIYRSAPDAALADSVLGEWLALADALRLHKGRVAELARDEVRRRLGEFTHAAAA